MAWEMQSTKPPKSYMSVSYLRLYLHSINIILFNNGFETHYQCQDRKNAFK